MLLQRILQGVAIIGLSVPITAAALPGTADAQVIMRNQIVQKLRLPPGAIRRHRVPPQAVGPVDAPRASFRRAPPRARPPVAEMRVPPRARPPVAEMRVPPRLRRNRVPPVAEMRVPPPRFEEPETVQGRVPKTNRTVAPLRAPGSNPSLAKSRPVADRKIASSDPNDFGQRGIDIAPTQDYPDSGRIDLEILFEYDSAQIRPESAKQLFELGEALNDPELESRRFMIAGHTDATGSADYNADLSRRRADAVSYFLVNYAGVSVERLVVEGYGESLLKYPDAPESGQNRRVEVINLGG